MSQGRFHRSLNLFDSTNLVVGSLIGSGVFIVSADVARQLGSPGWLLFTWVLAGLLTVMGCFIYGELASLFPHAGGQYIYLKEAFHPLMGFLYGWTLFTVIQTGTIAAVGIAFAKFLGILVPAVSAENILLDLGWVSLSVQQLIAIFVILFLTLLNCHSLEVGKKIQNSFTVVKVITLILVAGAGLLWIKGGKISEISSWWTMAQNGNSISWLNGFSLLGIALVGPFFAFDGWNNLTFTGDEIKEAPKTIPRALALGSIVVITLYLLVNISYLNLLPLDGIQNAAEDRVATAAILPVMGPMAENVMAVAIMISTFGCLNAMILMGARAYWAMAQDRLFFKVAGQLGEKSGVPQVGLLLQSVWAMALTLSGSYGNLLDYVIFASILSYVLTVIGVFRLRKKMPDVERAYTTPLYPILPALYVLVCGLFLIVLLWKKPMYTWPGLLIVLSGIPVYYFWRWRSGKLSLENS